MIYLDNAATTYPKPESVVQAMATCMREYCGNPGRGSHAMAVRASEKLYECRQEAMELFGAESPENVAFTLNTTYALNMAIKGLVPAGSHVILSDMEHNSVLRPVEEMRRSRGVHYDVFRTGGSDFETLERIRRLIRRDTAAVICTGCSNIINRTLPVREIGRLCENHGLYFILDGAQGAGIHDINMRRDKITALCVPGHKGLMGPQGTGLLLLRGDVPIGTLVEGGSGIHSADPGMPDFLPDRLEAGTMPTPGIAGLYEGIRYVRSRGLEEIRAHEAGLYRTLINTLRGDPRLVIYSSRVPGAIVLFNIKGISAQKTGYELDRRGICVRSGLHCAPLAHETIGTPDGGAVRVSFGPLSSTSDVTGFCNALHDVLKEVK